MKIKADWWLVSGLFFIVVGLLQLLQTLGGEQLDLWSVYGPAYILLGLGLLKRMKPAFWVILVFALISFLQPILLSSRGDESAGFSMFDIAGLIVLAILWFQMGKDKNK